MHALPESVDDASEQKHGQNGGVFPWGTDAGFDQPPEMDDACDGSDVDQTMQALPVFASHGPHDKGRRGGREQKQNEPGQKAHLDEAALEQVVDDGWPDDLPLRDDLAGMTGADTAEGCCDVVAGEEEDVGGEVERRVEEGVEADQATEADEKADARGETAQRGDGQRGQKDVERPVAGEVGDVVDRIGVELERAVAIKMQQVEEGGEAQEMQQELEGDDRSFRHGWFIGVRAAGGGLSCGG